MYGAAGCSGLLLYYQTVVVQLTTHCPVFCDCAACVGASLSSVRGQIGFLFPWCKSRVESCLSLLDIYLNAAGCVIHVAFANGLLTVNSS